MYLTMKLENKSGSLLFIYT